MKKMKFLLASTGALALASAASAQTYIRLSGSTAFRAATHSAINNILAPGYTVAYVGTDLSAAGQAIWTGNVGTTPVIIKTAWTGSAGGIAAVASNPQITPLKPFLDDATPAGASAASSFLTDNNVSNVAMTDVAQSSTIFSGGSYDTLSTTKVGVVTFTWAIGTSDTPAVSAAVAKITNIQSLQAQQLLSSGALPLSQLSGDPLDTAKVYVIGRDEDSGTRIVAFQDSGFGAGSSPTQYEATLDTTVTPNKVASIKPYPAQTILGVSYGVGHSGYASGGNVKDRLNANVQVSPKKSGLVQSAGFALIGYLGISDAAKLNLKPLSYNGVNPYLDFASSPKVQNDTAVREGTYTFWGYEFLATRSDAPNDVKAVASTLATQILNVDAELSGTKLSLMHVNRSFEGAVIAHN